ncbi:ABC-type proline/glycine betaine transport system substrate-binding protein [Bradyrhizobium diazoefficiens]
MNKAIFATLALGAAVAFAAPASAEKLKATLDGKSEVPATTTSGTGTADLDYDAASKKLSWKVTYSGLSGPATAAHFHGPAPRPARTPA